ncbi:cytochrome c biogenesis protein CcsA [bacterium AH-315-F18]|nr:cytochrome c biogenesis protein CcsA [bacterium AH-315-F18]
MMPSRTCPKIPGGWALLLLMISCALVWAQPASAQGTGDAMPTVAATPDRAPWSAELRDVFGALPVQEGGRVKPISTFAGFRLLRMNGTRTYRTTTGERLGPTGWLLDCLFYPTFARKQAFFLVQNDEVLSAVGLVVPGKRKRDRYTYDELTEARNAIFAKMREYQPIEGKDRTPLQQQTIRLAHSLYDFESLVTYLNFGRAPISIKGVTVMTDLFPDRTEVGVSEIVVAGPAIFKRASELAQSDRRDALAGFDAVLAEVERITTSTRFMAMFPPHSEAGVTTPWLAPWDVFDTSLRPEGDVRTQAELMAQLGALVPLRDDRAALLEGLDAFRTGVVALADARGEYTQIPLEVMYYKYQFFYYALILFVVGFLLTALTWLLPRSQKLAMAAPVPIVVGLGLLTAGIVLRCIIRGRPPVSTLYETILFIAAVAVLVGLVAEYLSRERVALGMSAFMGALGMFLAFKYETHEAVDTMPSLVAVLDTNFWLSTHVTSVTIGYSAGLLASAMAHVYLLGKVFGIKKGNTRFYKDVGRMVYGLICFSLLFAVVGTILGGIWANDSWGRFWGWDPKENGALLICLWEIAIIHGKMGGYIRDFGISMAAVFGGIVVATSWWGVNLLGIGLHSYGFTAGAFVGLAIFYGLGVTMMSVAGLHHLLTRNRVDKLEQESVAP